MDYINIRPVIGRLLSLDGGTPSNFTRIYPIVGSICVCAKRKITYLVQLKTGTIILNPVALRGCKGQILLLVNPVLAVLKISSKKVDFKPIRTGVRTELLEISSIIAFFNRTRTGALGPGTVIG